uniref:CYRIA/CYRIB Rac1 binding domain-containing protein n=1 Tax=Anopheles dirus TaxID=7168 RepID=A0A182NMF1_9DIPT
MGKLLSLLARDESTCCTPKTYDVFLDFENAAPTDLEREVYEEVDHVLRQSEIVLDEIQCYKTPNISAGISAVRNVSSEWHPAPEKVGSSRRTTLLLQGKRKRINQ